MRDLVAKDRAVLFREQLNLAEEFTTSVFPPASRRLAPFPSFPTANRSKAQQKTNRHHHAISLLRLDQAGTGDDGEAAASPPVHFTAPAAAAI